MSSDPISTSGTSVEKEQNTMPEDGVQYPELLTAAGDLHGGVRVDKKKPMDPKVFSSVLRASLSFWRQQGKRGVWIKLPLKLSNLVEPAVQEGFRYHYAEPDYLMLVYWIPETADVLPANASHRVGVGAFVMNSQREVLPLSFPSRDCRLRAAGKANAEDVYYVNVCSNLIQYFIV